MTEMQIPPSSEMAPIGATWDCPNCGEIRPRYIGDTISGYRVFCPECKEAEYFKKHPFGGEK